MSFLFEGPIIYAMVSPIPLRPALLALANTPCNLKLLYFCTTAVCLLNYFQFGSLRTLILNYKANLYIMTRGILPKPLTERGSTVIFISLLFLSGFLESKYTSWFYLRVRGHICYVYSSTLLFYTSRRIHLSRLCILTLSSRN